MPNKAEYNASLISITGTNNTNLRVLGNLYNEPFDSESVLSVVASLSHKPEVKWEIIYSTETWCTFMDQAAGGVLFVVSMEGELHKNSRGSWQVLDLECPEGLNSVWAANDNEAFAVGIKGERIHIIDDNFEVVHDPEMRRLNALHGIHGGQVFAVGDGGLVYRFDGTTWEELESPTNVNLLAVLCCSDTEVYVAGGKGTLLRWIGTGFELLEGPETAVTDLAIHRGQLYAAAGREGVQILRDDKLEEFKDIQVYRMNTIDDRLYCIGNRLVAQYDGEEWWGGNLTI